MTPVVFFSHSSADNERARALVQALEQGGLVKTTFDVRDLRHGQEYAPQLHKWLAHCQGAVLLLTLNVMNHAPWVLQEVSVLRSRSINERDSFRLFVIIDKEVLDDATWKQWFAPLKLDTLQRKKIVDKNEDPALTVAALRQELAGLSVSGDDYFSLLALLVGDALGDILKKQSAVNALSKGLELIDAEWLRIVGAPQALQDKFALRLCQGDFGQFGGIDAMFSALQKLAAKPLLQELLGVLRSYWIPLPLAARLAEGLLNLAPYGEGAGVPPNVLILQTEAGDAQPIADMYRERQFAPYYQQGTLVNVAGGNETAAGVCQAVYDELQAQLFPMLRTITPEQITAELATRLGQAMPRYVFIHIAAPATLAHVRLAARTYWPCLFLLSAAPAACAELARELGAPALALQPQAGSELQHLNALAVAHGYAN